MWGEWRLCGGRTTALKYARVSPYNFAVLLDAPVSSTHSERPRGIHVSDDWDEQPIQSLTREQAQALLANNPHAVSPWWVVAVQIMVGVLVALLVGAVGARWDVFWSALYGAGAVVIPGALMARGMTSAFTSVSPGASAVGFMVWALLKVGVSVVLLVLATRIVQPLSWPALLVGMVACMQVYWLALVWRRRG